MSPVALLRSDRNLVSELLGFRTTDDAFGASRLLEPFPCTLVPSSVLGSLILRPLQSKPVANSRSVASSIEAKFLSVSSKVAFTVFGV